MFDKIGEKIKTLAKVVCVIGIVASVVYGIVSVKIDGFNIGSVSRGLLIAVAGSLISWISLFFIYGFGQLISNSDVIARNIESIDSYNEEIVNKINEKKEVKEKKSDSTKKTEIKEEKTETPEDLEVKIVDIKCSKCGVDLSYSEEFLKDKTKIECPMCKNEIDVNK